METKQCKTCNEIKPIEEFGINRKVDKDNSTNFHAGIITRYRANCKPCEAIRAKQWRDKKKAEGKSYTGSGKISKYPEEDKLLISAIRNRIHNAKQNQKRNPERVFNITDDYMYQLYKAQEGLCALTGFEIVIEKATPYTLSIDKIVPEKGYMEGNVQWVCWAANRAKGDLSMTDFITFCEAITRKCRDYPEKEYNQVVGSA